MENRGEVESIRKRNREYEAGDPKSARSCLAVLLMFHGLILSQVLIVLVRLVPDWAKTYADSPETLSVNSRFLIGLSTWMMENPLVAALTVLAFLVGESAVFVATWRMKPKGAVSWWMRGTFVVGIVLIGWLYLSLYLTTLRVDSFVR